MAGRERSENVARKLKAAGKWQEFVDFRMSIEAKGMSKIASYNQGVTKFFKYLGDPTPDNSDKPDSDEDDLPAFVSLDMDDFKGKRAVSEKEAIDWAIANVGYFAIQSKAAPSSTAWLYLQLFRQDGTFLRDCLKKRVPNISKAEEDGGHIDDGRKQFNLLDKLLSEQGQDTGSGMVRNNDGVLPNALSGSNQT